MNPAREGQESKSRDNFVAELNIDEVIEFHKFPEDNVRKDVEEEEESGDEEIDNAGTFFTEGMLDEPRHEESNELLVVIDTTKNKTGGEEEVRSHFKTEFEINHDEESFIEPTKNTTSSKPSVNFKLNKNIEYRDKPSKATSSAAPYKPYSKSSRSRAQNGEKG